MPQLRATELEEGTKETLENISRSKIRGKKATSQEMFQMWELCQLH